MRSSGSPAIRTLATLALLVATLPFARAQSDVKVAYPQSRVTLVTHSSPGGGSDLFLRDLAKHLGPIMGVHFVVENITGGSGAKAMAFVARAKADGSVFYATTPTYIQTSLLSKPEYGYTALEPVAIVFQDPEVIFTRADAPWKSLVGTARLRAPQSRQVALGRRQSGVARTDRAGAARAEGRASRHRSCRTKAAAT